ncbi:hypothetical protein [Zunongwangia endophytica]|uniref:Viral A-type inclusion protein n=1 Tax=Zunongwangia endophytica TaxID=1808945 RepID=A0ABV8HE24_9FLAO|nr:hypothetical protein [Zunongwangia endophytica]MDN3596661.1 hypothetical protein [Zunongwangia endophytica]
MKLIYKAALLLSFATLAYSCAEDTSAKKKEYDNLFHEVLDIHDEVMPKMADIPELSKQLQTIADTSASAEKYMQAEKKLQEADKVMMKWMHSFSDEFVKDKAEVQKMNNEQLQERIDALEEELDDVKAMQEKVDSSIENAENLIQ